MRNAYPWLFDVSLQSRYSFIQNETWELTGLAGIAIGEVYVKFRRGTPNSFDNLRNRYVDPYAKSSFLLGNPLYGCDTAPHEPLLKEAIS